MGETENSGLGKRIEDQLKPIQPFIFYNEKNHVENPFYNVKTEINGPDRFAITRATENGKYVRGGQLYFKLDKVEIFTDIDNIIFVDMINNTIRVNAQDHMVKEILSQEDPEQREYVLLITGYDSDEEIYNWESIVGRTRTYNFIVDNIDFYNMDPKKSFVLTANVCLKDALTVEEFVKYIKNSELVEEDMFDIEEYIY